MGHMLQVHPSPRCGYPARSRTTVRSDHITPSFLAKSDLFGDSYSIHPQSEPRVANRTLIHRRRRVSCKRADLSKRGKKEYTQAFNNHHHHLAPSTSSSTSISWSDSLDHETEIHRREKDIDGPHTHTKELFKQRPHDDPPWI